MSTITDLESTTSGSSSMGIINANFDNLNTDKVEAADVRTFTNKTIDADLNTITDLTPTNIKTGNKTGLDTNIVTGTKGAANEIAMWNADGDLVTSGYTPSGLISSRQIFVPCLKDSDTSPYTPAVIGPFAFAQLDSAEIGYFNFHVPADFTTLTSAELVMIPDATETLTMTQCTVNTIAEGEVYTGTAVSTGSQTKSVTVSLMTKWRLDTLTNSPFSGMVAGDTVGVAITSGTTLFRVLGLLIKYT